MASKLLCEKCENSLSEKGWNMVDWDRNTKGQRFREIWSSERSDEVIHIYGCKHEGYYDDWKKEEEA